MVTTLLLPILAAAMAVPVSGFKLVSKDFIDGAAIPAVSTCEGGNTSPELSWVGAPKGAKSFALLVNDPDAPDPRAPQKDVTHWVVYDIPSTAIELPRNASAGTLPAGALQGKNEKGEQRYMGPCPPIGEHRYFFTLYALDDRPKLKEGATRSEVLDAIEKHVVAKTQLMGTYAKGKRASK
jgi:Raf kinase inhibitor-like YbhB/YbcL family protein